jgi:serine/threonine protein phosphatase PrpC
MACPSCGAEVGDADLFCEDCGFDLAAHQAAAPGAVTTAVADGAQEASDSPLGEVKSHQTVLVAEPAITQPAAARLCTECGGVVEDGWCTTCGARAVDERDHFSEQPRPWVAGVCDRGRHHARNEDGMAIGATDDRCALVICDGVTSATASEKASLIAARAARDLLMDEHPADDASVAGRIVHWSDALGRAASAANAQAVAVAAEVGDVPDPPSCTFVAAVWHLGVIVAGNVGDSRAYWFGDDGQCSQLGVDDSVAAEQIASGVSREIAEAGPEAHAIVRWLGVDAPDVSVQATTMTATSDGWLVVCSDGLWNYASAPTALRDVLQQCQQHVGDDPLALCEALVAWANERGGHDNISAAVARVPGLQHSGR